MEYFLLVKTSNKPTSLATSLAVNPNLGLNLKLLKLTICVQDEQLVLRTGCFTAPIHMWSLVDFSLV